MTVVALVRQASVALAVGALAAATSAAVASAQTPASAPATPAAASPPRAASCIPQGPFPPPAAYRSVEAAPDGRVTFRLCAPEATTVRVTSPDAGPAIPGGGPGVVPGLELARDTLGLWTATTSAPVAPGTYRFLFRVNGVRVPDPQGTRFSEERTATNGVFEVPGPAGAFQAYDRAVPHGAVTMVEYWSTSLGVRRRAHVYTPPGYMTGSARYPVLYLVHGAGDSDDSWTSIGHANYILDNLIAAGKARPMIVVMPFGHTPERQGADMLVNTDFGRDLFTDLIPYVEKSWRTVNGPATRAMAGLSMGGAHTLQFGLTHPETFGWVGVFSMGFVTPEQAAAYDSLHSADLRRGARTFRLVYYAIGKDDFLYRTVAPTRAVLDRAGVRYVYHESEGGHTWLNWRDYLADFAPRLFR